MTRSVHVNAFRNDETLDDLNLNIDFENSYYVKNVLKAFYNFVHIGSSTIKPNF